MTPVGIEATLMREFGVKRAQARKYLTLARKRVAKASEGIDPEEYRARVDGLFTEAFEAAMVPNTLTGQPNAAAMATVAQRVAEMRGLMAPQKFTIDAKVTGLADLLGQVLGEGSSESGS
jgi:hypothetical protein